MSIKIFFDEWFHHTPNLILNKWGKTPVHHLSILGIELGSLGCTTACPTTEPRLSLLHKPDQLCWKLTRSGEFTVKSMYIDVINSSPFLVPNMFVK